MANVLAQVARETGRRMAPVRETFADSDKQAIARLDAAFAKGQLTWVSKPYWRSGYFGRGQIQITHEDNYKRLGAVLGVDLQGNPELALEPEVSAAIAVTGMRDGLFTGRKLAEFRFPDSLDAPPSRNPRRIVNGPDGSDEQVAKYHRGFHRALVAAGWSGQAGPAVELRAGNTTPQEAVRQLQRDLAELRYFSGRVDGLFGPLTAAAVKSFQSDNGLKADGIAGPLTLEAMRTAIPRPERDVSEADLQDSRAIQEANAMRDSASRLRGGAVLGGGVTAAGVVVEQAERARDLALRANSVLGGLKDAAMSMWPLLLIAAGVGLVIWIARTQQRSGDRIAAFRVQDAREGKNLGR